MKLLSIVLVFVLIAGSAFGEDPGAKPTPTPPVRDIPDAPSHLRQQPATSNLISATPPLRRFRSSIVTHSSCKAARKSLLSTEASAEAKKAASKCDSAPKGLSERFGGIAALGNVSFDGKAGRIRELIGANGAGKTTHFSCLSHH